MAESAYVLTSDFIKINISNSKNNSVSFEKRFPKKTTIAVFKNKLEFLTGGSSASMQLELYDGDKLICKIDNDAAYLGTYPIEDNMRVHVIDDFSFAADNVEKFELTETQYDQRTGSVKNYLRENRLGKYNEEEMKKLEEKKLEAAAEEKRRIELCQIDSRCKITVKGKPTRLGKIVYVGELEHKNGIYIGIKFDEPLGTNDGSVDGKRYFDCEPKYGGFVLATAVEVGDYPPETDDLDEEI